MMNKEEYKRELVRMWDSLRDKKRGSKKCDGVLCEDCPLYRINIDCEKPIYLFDVIEAVEKWSKENPKVKYKVSNLEYDILKDYCSNADIECFFEDDLLLSLLRKGYFKGAYESSSINEYFAKCYTGISSCGEEE